MTVNIKKIIQVVLGNFGNISIDYFLSTSKNTISYEYLMDVLFERFRSIFSKLQSVEAIFSFSSSHKEPINIVKALVLIKKC